VVVIVVDKQQDVDLSSPLATATGHDARTPAASSSAGAVGSATKNVPRRASVGSFRQSLTKKKSGGAKTAPMSYIPGIRPSSKHHAKRFNGVLPKYGVQPSNAGQLAEVRFSLLFSICILSVCLCPSFYLSLCLSLCLCLYLFLSLSVSVSVLTAILQVDLG